MSFILVGVDGSDVAQRALEAAVGQAELAGAELRVINVVVLPTTGVYEFGPFDIDRLRDIGNRLLVDAVAKLDAVHGGKSPVPITTRVLVGHAGIEMLQAAKEDGGAAMVIAGSRGFGGFRSLMLGSVTTYLVHHLTCPLLIIPPEVDVDPSSVD